MRIKHLLILFLLLSLLGCQRKYKLDIRDAVHNLDCMVYSHFLGTKSGKGFYKESIFYSSGHINYFSNSVSLSYPTNVKHLSYRYYENNYQPFANFDLDTLYQLQQYFKTNKVYNYHIRERAVAILIEQLLY